ncbi:MAG: hypothetical protein WD042_17130 [Phycisphaeraceae bacterium]
MTTAAKAKRTTRGVYRLVKQYVTKHQPREFKLVMLDDAVMRITTGVVDEDEHWYVVVRHDPELPRLLGQYSEKLMKIEDQIRKKEGIVVSLQSMLPPY